MGIDAGRSGLQLEPGGALVASPGFGRIQQRLPHPAGATLWRHGQVLDPGPLPEPYRNNVEIDGRESNNCLVVIGHQNGRPIVRDGCLEATSRDIQRPVSWPYPGSSEQPLVGSGEGTPFTWSCLPDHAGDTQSDVAASAASVRGLGASSSKSIDDLATLPPRP